MRSILAFAVLCLLLCVPAGAYASTMTYNITFTASGPYPIQGSYTLTFDPTQSYTNATSGLTVNSLSPISQSASGFNFDPHSGGGELMIGGLLNGVASPVPGTSDYRVDIVDFNTASPVVEDVYLSRINGTFSENTYSGTVTQVVAATPEPSSILLLATGLLAAAFVARRRLA